MATYLTVEGALGIVVFIIGSWLSLGNIERSGNFRAIDFSLLSMAIVYGLAMPAIVAAADEHIFLGSDYISRSPDTIFLHFSASVLAMVGLIVGWQIQSSRLLNIAISYYSSSSSASMFRVFFLMLGIAVVSWYLYLRDYGGFLGYFEYNRLIRSQIFDTFDRSRFSFLQPFGGFAIIACLGFWGLLIARKTRTLSALIGFALSFAMSAYVLVANSGRIAIAATIAILALSVLAKRRINPLTWFLGYFVVIFSGALFLFWISNALMLKGGDDLGEYLIRELSFPIVAFFAQAERGYLFHLFHDVFVSPLYLLPSSITSSWLQEAGEINTEVILGVKKGVDGNTTSVPTDLLTYGLMQFHLLGVILYAILFGFLLRAADALGQSIKPLGVRSVFQVYVWINLATFGIFYAQPKHLILTHFALIATLIVGIVLKAIRRLLAKVT